VRAGRFPRDCFKRLNVIRIDIAPRESGRATRWQSPNRFLSHFAAAMNKARLELSDDARAFHPALWLAGNVAGAA